jgi:hypothetical protein
LWQAYGVPHADAYTVANAYQAFSYRINLLKELIKNRDHEQDVTVYRHFVSTLNTANTLPEKQSWRASSRRRNVGQSTSVSLVGHRRQLYLALLIADFPQEAANAVLRLGQRLLRHPPIPSLNRKPRLLDAPR